MPDDTQCIVRNKSLQDRDNKRPGSALVFTVDMLIAGARYRDYHSWLADAAGLGGQLCRLGQVPMHPCWVWDIDSKIEMIAGDAGYSTANTSTFCHPLGSNPPRPARGPR